MNDKITVEDIPAAPKETPPIEPKSSPGENPFTGKDERLDQHLGRVGRYIGGGPEKAGNIAYIICISSIIILVCGGLATAYAETEKIAAIFDRVVTGAFGLLSGAMGYLFGSSEKHK